MHYYRNYAAAIQRSLAQLEVTDVESQSLDPEDGFARICELSKHVQRAGRAQFLCGNGASAAFASHMAVDWTKNGNVRTHAFNDIALLTALGNDLGYDATFAAPLTLYAQAGDLLGIISSSGNSANVLKAINTARQKHLHVITFSGLQADNQSRQMGDINFYIPAKTYGIVESTHQILLHAWLDKFMGIEEWSRDTCQNMHVDGFQL